MLVLGLESSCDESSVAIVGDRQGIIAQKIHSQFDAHRPYGGVVPEIAARHHIEIMPMLVQQVLQESGFSLSKFNAIAATAGPGLLGGLMVSSVMAKAMALSAGIPFLAINHLEAHALTPRLVTHTPQVNSSSTSKPLQFPYLLLLISGGHCQIVCVNGVGNYQTLATTLDDAVGEAFDKTAKLLGLGFPGGPFVEKAAQKSQNPHRFSLPRPMVGNKAGGKKPSGNFSFSGLKAAVRRQVEDFPRDENGRLYPEDSYDMALAFELAVVDIMINRLEFALNPKHHPLKAYQALVVAGGVGSNQRLRNALVQFAHQRNLDFIAPPPMLCADNAAMIAWAGIERLSIKPDLKDDFAFKARPRWPLAEMTELI